MIGLIVACGEKDSQGRGRAAEQRGLLRLGDREVIVHALDRMFEAGVRESVLLTEVALIGKYERVLAPHPYRVRIVPTPIANMSSLSAYIYGVSQFCIDEPMIAVADDNVFTFNFDELFLKSRQVNGNVLAVRHEDFICEDTRGMNFGRVSIDSRGKIVQMSHSFFGRTTIDSRLISLDVWVFHPGVVSELRRELLHQATPQDIVKAFIDRLHCVEVNEGFWADIGKPRLRLKAQEYFGER